MHTTIISADQLSHNLQHPDWVIIDCRYSLQDPEYGQNQYSQSHIPNAVFANMNTDLSASVIAGKTGRHPLPEIDALVQTFSKWGIDKTTQVVVYDDTIGAFAARLWWLLRWLGHEQTAVLDGGWKHWLQKSLAVNQEIRTSHFRNFVPSLCPELLINADDVLTILDNPDFCILDARTEDRFRGENETIDSIGGHIPNAVPAPFMQNTDSNGLFLSREQLKNRFQMLLAGVDPANAVFYCGSGVTACHNILAFKYAGWGEGKLYAGSWSEWITDSNRPIATGS
ncbi:MAG: sulfurtransferase [SAR324 cluster bacterium]|nr:sulfurtransferase [SAR324 cluster bacterium]